MDNRAFEYLSEFKQLKQQECGCADMVPFCKCSGLIKLEIKRIEANIPLKFLPFTLDDVKYDSIKEQKKAIIGYIDNFKNNFRGGIGLYLHGKKGLAKGLLGCLVLSAIIQKGHNCYFTTLDAYIKAVIGRDEETIEKIETVDVLMVDGIGKEYVAESGVVSKCFEKLLKMRCDKMLPMILTSGKTDVELGHYFGIDSLVSLVREHFVTMEFSGVDYRFKAGGK